jgi:nucleotide-binding universal stress UspA family protein
LATIPPPLQQLVPKEFGKKENQAQRYLGRIAKKLETKGIKVRTEVLFWPPAEAIASYAEDNGADIIVMSSHGYSGPSRWAHGSVADKVLRASRVPVLIVRAPGCIPGI